MVYLDEQIAPHTSPRTSDVQQLPPADSSGRRLASRIKIAVREATSGKIHWLDVEVAAAGVVLRGRSATFYSKQVAQHVAMRIAGNRQLVNEIEVG
jgi:osmotically-inducible protein OsmY